MKKILVPVDFSIPSNCGYNFAYDLAASIGAELVVVHMYLPSSEPTYSLEKLQADAPRRKKELLNHLKDATQRFTFDKNVKITYELSYAEKKDIATYAKKHEVELIVMGTHGSGNALKSAWGSNTSSVIEKAHCPVLAIPEGMIFDNMLDIAYATNYDDKDLDAILKLAEIAKQIRSSLHFVHVNLVSGPIDTEAAERFEAELRPKLNGLAVTFNSWSANSVEEGLEIFCNLKKIDILAMLTKDRTTWAKMFGEKSVTKSMALRNILPLLAFH